jgi:hypothetical protein
MELSAPLSRFRRRVFLQLGMTEEASTLLQCALVLNCLLRPIAACIIVGYGMSWLSL